MTVTKRIVNRIVEPDLLDFLYDEVLSFCENDKIDFSGYNLNKNPFLNSLRLT